MEDNSAMFLLTRESCAVTHVDLIASFVFFVVNSRSTETSFTETIVRSSLFDLRAYY